MMNFIWGNKLTTKTQKTKNLNPSINVGFRIQHSRKMEGSGREENPVSPVVHTLVIWILYYSLFFKSG